MSVEDIPALLEFLSYVEAEKEPPLFSFHGGEPFSYLDFIDSTITAIVDKIPSAHFFIQTNGSLIYKNESFLKRWGDRLSVSISYDFLYQDLNRTPFDITNSIETLKENGVTQIQFQYVMPILDSKVFSLDAVKSITNVCYKSGIRDINLIPLRHMRGGDKFEVLVDQLDINQFFGAFTRFVQLLYVMGIHAVIDGHDGEIDKHYFDQHKQLVLSPDGLIYPEYDFLEYKRVETAIGRWRSPIFLNRIGGTGDILTLQPCVSCPVRDECGLKYLYKIFGGDPTTSKCAQFYYVLNTVIKHNQKLKQQKSIFHWVGI